MITKIRENKEKSKSLMNMAEITLKRLNNTNMEEYPTNTLLDYYGIIHQLLEAIASKDGVKARGEGAHQELIDYVSKKYKLTEQTRRFLQQLRDLRNRISYEGFMVKKDFIKSNKEKIELEEVDKVLVLENENFFSLEGLRKDISKIKFNEFNLRVKSYVKIPAGSIKKKLYPRVNKKLNENSENNILIELFKEGKIKYRIFSYKEDKTEHTNNITVLIENPRLVEEISDFLRLCLIIKKNLKTY